MREQVEHQGRGVVRARRQARSNAARHPGEIRKVLGIQADAPGRRWPKLHGKGFGHRDEPWLHCRLRAGPATPVATRRVKPQVALSPRLRRRAPATRHRRRTVDHALPEPLQPPPNPRVQQLVPATRLRARARRPLLLAIAVHVAHIVGAAPARRCRPSASTPPRRPGARRPLARPHAARPSQTPRCGRQNRHSCPIRARTPLPYCPQPRFRVGSGLPERLPEGLGSARTVA
jgi:hypothetical protein